MTFTARKWTEEKISLLKELYSDTQTKELCPILGFTVSAIYQAAAKLDLHKSKEFLQSEKSGILIKGSTIGKATQFVKGQTAINKGKKWDEYMSPEGQKNSLKTTFKSGQLPHNTKTDGEITIRDIKERPYKYIRISKAKWELLHRVLWKEKYGEIPEGCNIQFIDGNSLNCVIENLKLVTKSENMLENQIHKYPIEIKQTIRALTKLKKKIYGKEQNG